MKRKSQRGNVIVEFALGAPLLIALFLGTFEFGYSFFVYNRLQTAVRAGARYGSMATYNSASTTPDAAFSNAVKNTVIYGTPAGGGSPIVSGLATSNVNITVTPISAGGVARPQDITVAITNFTFSTVVANVRVNNKPRATFPYMGRFAP